MSLTTMHFDQYYTKHTGPHTNTTDDFSVCIVSVFNKVAQAANCYEQTELPQAMSKKDLIFPRSPSIVQ